MEIISSSRKLIKVDYEKKDVILKPNPYLMFKKVINMYEENLEKNEESTFKEIIFLCGLIINMPIPSNLQIKVLDLEGKVHFMMNNFDGMKIVAHKIYKIYSSNNEIFSCKYVFDTFVRYSEICLTKQLYYESFFFSCLTRPVKIYRDNYLEIESMTSINVLENFKQKVDFSNKNTINLFITRAKAVLSYISSNYRYNLIANGKENPKGYLVSSKWLGILGEFVEKYGERVKKNVRANIEVNPVIFRTYFSRTVITNEKSIKNIDDSNFEIKDSKNLCVPFLLSNMHLIDFLPIAKDPDPSQAYKNIILKEGIKEIVDYYIIPENLYLPLKEFIIVDYEIPRYFVAESESFEVNLHHVKILTLIENNKKEEKNSKTKMKLNEMVQILIMQMSSSEISLHNIREKILRILRDKYNDNEFIQGIDINDIRIFTCLRKTRFNVKLAYFNNLTFMMSLKEIKKLTHHEAKIQLIKREQEKLILNEYISDKNRIFLVTVGEVNSLFCIANFDLSTQKDVHKENICNKCNFFYNKIGESEIIGNHLEFHWLLHDYSIKSSEELSTLSFNDYSLSNRRPCIRGLVNLGLTCFMNTILQCLLRFPLFTKFFLFDVYNNLNSKVVSNKNCVYFNRQFSKFLSDFLLFSVYHPFNPSEMVSVIRKTMPCFQRGEMQDAHEFLFKFIGRLSANFKEGEIYFVDNNKEHGKNKTVDKGFINSLFTGSLKQIIKCTECNYISETKEDFNFLGLGIPKYDSVIYVVIFDSNGEKHKYKIKINKLNKMNDLLNILGIKKEYTDIFLVDRHTKYLERVIDEDEPLYVYFKKKKSEEEIVVYYKENQSDDHFSPYYYINSEYIEEKKVQEIKGDNNNINNINTNTNINTNDNNENINIDNIASNNNNHINSKKRKSSELSSSSFKGRSGRRRSSIKSQCSLFSGNIEADGVINLSNHRHNNNDIIRRVKRYHTSSYNSDQSSIYIYFCDPQSSEAHYPAPIIGNFYDLTINDLYLIIFKKFFLDRECFSFFPLPNKETGNKQNKGNEGDATEKKKIENQNNKSVAKDENDDFAKTISKAKSLFKLSFCRMFDDGGEICKATHIALNEGERVELNGFTRLDYLMKCAIKNPLVFVVETEMRFKNKQYFDNSSSSSLNETRAYNESNSAINIPLIKKYIKQNIIFNLFLEDTISNYFAEETVELNCSNCKKNVQKLKFCQLNKIPNYLIIQLKRFEQVGSNLVKNTTLIKYPITNLDMSQFMKISGKIRFEEMARTSLIELEHSPRKNKPKKEKKKHKASIDSFKGEVKESYSYNNINNNNNNNNFITISAHNTITDANINNDYLYDLVAIALHKGDLAGGHYFSYVRGNDKSWWLIDDDKVKKFENLNDIVSENAYILFYARKNKGYSNN